jgi:hypothetical protein
VDFFGCCSQRGCGRPQVAFRRRVDAVGPGDTFLVLDLGLDVVDGIARLDVKGNGLSGEGLYENLR